VDRKCIYILESIKEELVRIRKVCDGDERECWEYFLMKLEKEIEDGLRSVLRSFS